MRMPEATGSGAVRAWEGDGLCERFLAVVSSFESELPLRFFGWSQL
jgi:hypothetical protein